MTADELSGKYGQSVIYGIDFAVCEIDSAPSYALQSIRILHPLHGRIFVKTENLELIPQEKIEELKKLYQIRSNELTGKTG